MRLPSRAAASVTAAASMLVTAISGVALSLWTVNEVDLGAGVRAGWMKDGFSFFLDEENQSPRPQAAGQGDYWLTGQAPTDGPSVLTVPPTSGPATPPPATLPYAPPTSYASTAPTTGPAGNTDTDTPRPGVSQGGQVTVWSGAQPTPAADQVTGRQTSGAWEGSGVTQAPAPATTDPVVPADPRPSVSTTPRASQTTTQTTSPTSSQATSPTSSQTTSPATAVRPGTRTTAPQKSVTQQPTTQRSTTQGAATRRPTTQNTAPRNSTTQNSANQGSTGSGTAGGATTGTTTGASVAGSLATP